MNTKTVYEIREYTFELTHSDFRTRTLPRGTDLTNEAFSEAVEHHYNNAITLDYDVLRTFDTKEEAEEHLNMIKEKEHDSINLYESTIPYYLVPFFELAEVRMEYDEDTEDYEFDSEDTWDTWHPVPNSEEADLVITHLDELEEEMKRCYRECLESRGRLMYKIYIWSDGEIQTLEDFQGSHTYLVAKDYEDRTLTEVTTIEEPFFNWRDFCPDTVPEDEEEAEKLCEETIDWLCDDYYPLDTLYTVIRNL